MFASGMSRTEPPSRTPALFTRISTSQASAFLRSPSLVTSSFSTARVTPRAFAWRFRVWIGAQISTVAMTSNPFSARRIAASCPNPVPAPVIKTFFTVASFAWGQPCQHTTVHAALQEAAPDSCEKSGISRFDSRSARRNRSIVLFRHHEGDARRVGGRAESTSVQHGIFQRRPFRPEQHLRAEEGCVLNGCTPFSLGAANEKCDRGRPAPQARTSVNRTITSTSGCLAETSNDWEWIKHERSAVREVIDCRQVVCEVWCRVMRSRGHFVAITLLDDKTVTVSLVPPHVVLDVSRLGSTRTRHAAQQCSQGA